MLIKNSHEHLYNSSDRLVIVYTSFISPTHKFWFFYRKPYLYLSVGQSQKKRTELKGDFGAPTSKEHSSLTPKVSSQFPLDFTSILKENTSLPTPQLSLPTQTPFWALLSSKQPSASLSKVQEVLYWWHGSTQRAQYARPGFCQHLHRPNLIHLNGDYSHAGR